MNFDFGEVLSRAWQITWKHKMLWIFGVFAGCSRGGGGWGGGSSSVGGEGNGPGNQPFPQLQRFFEQLGQWMSDRPGVVVLLAVIALVLVMLTIFLGTIGRIGLIRGTYQAEGSAGHPVFGELFSESLPYFWRVFGLSLLIFLITLLIFIPLKILGAITAGIGLLCILPLLCVLIPVLWGVSVVIEQANVAIVLENLGIRDGLRRGWEVVRANIGPMILLALILFIGSGAVGFVIALPILAAAVPLIFGAAANNANLAWITVVCCAAYFPVLLVLSGILSSYIQSAWTLTYMRLTAKPQDNPPAVVEANA